MKTIFSSIALLCLMGCTSKPTDGNVIWLKVHYIPVTPCAYATGCTYYEFSEPVNYGVGSVSHVTREQWEAAQRLFHSSLACGEHQHWSKITTAGALPPGEYVKGLDSNTFWYCEKNAK